jgi:hypothetical protein
MPMSMVHHLQRFTSTGASGVGLVNAHRSTLAIAAGSGQEQEIRDPEVIKMGSIRKQPLDANRVRTIPEEGFSWIDRRFLRHGFSHTLSATEILLYWFLCSVADKQGLSYYSDPRISTLLKLSPGAIEHARHGLIRRELVLYRAPLYQVVALPRCPAGEKKIPWPPAIASPPKRSSQPELRPIREILKGLL